jgi:hypothetical protein
MEIIWWPKDKESSVTSMETMDWHGLLMKNLKGTGQKEWYYLLARLGRSKHSIHLSKVLGFEVFRPLLAQHYAHLLPKAADSSR